MEAKAWRHDASVLLRKGTDLGGARLADVRRADVKDLADRMVAEGLDAITVRNALLPLRALRRAVSCGDVAVNPTSGLDLPAVRGRRERVASPAEAEALLSALPDAERALDSALRDSAIRVKLRPTASDRTPLLDEHAKRRLRAGVLR